MHNTINNLENIKKKLVNYSKAKIIAVSKTFNQEHIVPLFRIWSKRLWGKQGSRSIKKMAKFERKISQY